MSDFVTCGLLPARLLRPWGFSRQEYWSGLHALLRGIVPNQGLKPGVLHCRRILTVWAPGKPTRVEIAWWTQESEAQPRPRRPGPGWANSHSLGVGEEAGRAIMGSHRVFSCAWIHFRSGPQDRSPGSSYLWGLWHLWSVEGTEMAPFPGGRGLILGRSVNSKDSRKGPYCCFRSAIGWSVRLLAVKLGGSSPPRDGGVGF